MPGFDGGGPAGRGPGTGRGLGICRSARLRSGLLPGKPPRMRAGVGRRVGFLRGWPWIASNRRARQDEK